MRKDYCIVIENGLTGERIKIPNAQDLSPDGKNSIIEAYTEDWSKNCIGYSVSYLFEA